MRLKIFLFLFMSCSYLFLQGQNQQKIIDTLNPSHPFYKKTIIPASLIVLGLVVHNSAFEKNIQIEIRKQVGNDYFNPIDDYLQFVPVAQMYLANISNIKAKNHWFDQSKYLFISNVISASITEGLKRVTQKTRPNNTTSTFSFPSGHTTFAFTNATVLYNEFKDSSPFLAYSGYGFASTTGAFRMINNKHWLSDVLVGAGIGIIVTHLVYYFKPLQNFNPFKKYKNVTFLQNTKGFYFAYQF